jgi:hypothetical protein
MHTWLICISVLALVLSACADEKPDQPKEQEAAERDQRPLQDERRQRTLGQSESARIYNQGALR